MKLTTLVLTAAAAAAATAGSAIAAADVDAAATTDATATSPDGFKATDQPSGACNNLGLQYAYYRDDFDFVNASSFQTYDPTELKRARRRIRETGVTTFVSYGYDENAKNANLTQAVYPDHAERKLPARFFALNHRGYLYAATTGTYHFYTNAADDIEFIWLGRRAYAGWSRRNANETVQINPDYAPGIGELDVPLRGGYYYPLRIVYKQGDGNAQLGLSILDPDDTPLLGFPDTPTPSPGNANKIVQFSCDGITAPPYPPFGYEW